MLVVIPFSQADSAQAIRLAEWIEELGGCLSHSLLTVRDARVGPEIVSQILNPLTRSFGKVIGDIVYPDDGVNAWPFSPNRMFNRAAKFVELEAPQPFLWLEPDAIPLEFGWLDKIEAEYAACGKPFLGDRVEVENVPLHCSGVAVYPAQMSRHAGEALLAQDIAWDVFAARQIVPLAAWSELLSHSWKHGAFESQEQVEREIFAFKPRCVLFHSDKTGSLFPLLRQNLSGADKDRARCRLRDAVRYGKITKPTNCERCNQATEASRLHGHHWHGYGNALDVIWLCASCHNEVDAEKIALHGERNANAALTDEQAKQIRIESSAGASGKDLAVRFGVSEATISFVINRKNYRQVSGGAESRHAAETLGAGDAEAEQNQPASTGRTALNRDAGQTQHHSGSSAPPAQTFDILIKSYPADYEFLRYCLASIAKFGSGFRRIVLVLPKGSEKVVPIGLGLRVDVHEILEQGEGYNIDGYMMQQAVKASAHDYTDADFILHVDSDCVFQRPFTPWDFFCEGKPIWYMTPYEAVSVPWRGPTEKFVGERVPFEFMRRLPQLIPRSLHLAASAFSQARHHLKLTDYILSQPNREFSEFNALGALAWLRSRGDFHWVDTTKVEMPALFAKQYRSYDGITPETKAEIETVLGGDATCATTETCSPGSSAEPTSEPESSAVRVTKEGWWVIEGDSHISKWIEESGRLDHDQWLLRQILPLIPEGGTVVDGGAFIGDHTIAYQQAVGGLGHVYAFEPNPIAFKCLDHNVAKFPGHLHLFNGALSDKPDEHRHIKQAPNAGASALLEKGETGGAIILTETVDDTLSKATRCDFIKLDLEGCELKALRGAEKTIEKFRPILLIEVNSGALKRQGDSPTDLLSWLRLHGYHSKSVQELFVPDPPQYDLLCRPIPKSPGLTVTLKVQPWQSKPESLEEINVHALRLKEFCTAPAYTRQVREQLREAGVIK